MFYYMNQPRTPSSPIGLVKTKPDLFHSYFKIISQIGV